MSAQMTHEDYMKKFNSLPKSEEYEVLGKYQKAAIKLKYRYKVCGQEFEMKPNNFNNGQRYPHCNGKFKLTTEEFKEKVKKLVGDEYIVKSEYQTAFKKVKLLHTICNEYYEVTPNDFLNGGYRCSYCAGNKKLTLKDIMKRVNEDGEYTIENCKYNRENFKNVHSPIYITHNQCGKTFLKSYNNLRNGQICTYCSAEVTDSKPVKRIKRFLEKRNIEYKTEVTFKDLIFKKKPLKFDFYIIDYDIYLEYDGSQHYICGSKNSFFNEERFNDIVKSDNMKEKYCKKHGLKFYRISYREDEIEALRKILGIKKKKKVKK